MAYDAARGLHVLFGSQFSNDPHTWTYDVATNVWRDMQPATMPPTDRNDAVLTYDPVSRVVLALVKVTEGDGDDARHRIETWSYDAGANRWTRMLPNREPDAAGNRTRNLIFAPELRYLETIGSAIGFFTRDLKVLKREPGERSRLRMGQLDPAVLEVIRGSRVLAVKGVVPPRQNRTGAVCPVLALQHVPMFGRVLAPLA